MTIQRMLVAIDWLQSNEGDLEERNSCLAAAEFLRLQVLKRLKASDRAAVRRYDKNANETVVEQVHRYLNRERAMIFGNILDTPIEEEKEA